MDNPVVMITGAAQGLGNGFAHAFASEGYRLSLADLKDDLLEARRNEFEAAGTEAIAMRTDVAERESVQNWVRATISRYGQIDVLINNAQIVRAGPFIDMTEDDLTAVWQSGLLGTFNCMHECHNHLASSRGSIINIVSGAGLSGVPGMSVYAATKEAIRTLTRISAVEWGPLGIRVNAISPSALTPALETWAKEFPEEFERRSNDIPLGRFGDPVVDIGRVAVFLASADAGYITGSTLVVDGGTHYLH